MTGYIRSWASKYSIKYVGIDIVIWIVDKRMERLC